MFRGGPTRTGGYEGSGPTLPIEAKWAFETGGRISSSTVVVGGTVYAGSYDNHVYALSAESGQEQWAFETDRVVKSSPTVAGGAVYVGSYDNHVYALSVESGQEQ